MKVALDHVVFAAPDLDAACADFAERTGVVPAAGGAHAGQGTQNALASLGSGTYLEIIAPDPENATPKNLGGRLRELDEPSLFTWALRTDALPRLARDLEGSGIEPSPIRETQRKAPGGSVLAWDLMGLPGLRGAWPFFIDWHDSAHPSESAPLAGTLVSLEVALPVDEVTKLPFGHATGVTLRTGAPGITLRITTPRGEAHWQASDPRGFFA